MISNQYSIYIIFTIIHILLDINEEYYIDNIINKNENSNIKKNHLNHNNKNNSNSNNNCVNDEKDKIEVDGKEEQNDEININNIYKNNNNIPFEEFKEIKKGILLYIENNTQNKEKKKLIYLMKINKIDNSFITLKKKEKDKNDF